MCSLSLALLLLGVSPAEAVKVTLEKEPVLSDSGELVGYHDLDPALLADLGVVTLAEHPTYLAGEVAESGLPAFLRLAADYGLLTAIRRDWDVVRVNGYSFPSDGQPSGLPPDLALTQYEGPVALYLVQLRAPPTPTWYAALAQVGAVVAYYPENTYLVRAAATAMPALRSVEGVQHVSLFQPAYKVQRSLLEAVEAMPQSPSTLPHSPSIAQGWGRVNLDTLLQEEVAVVALDQDHGGAGRRFTASGQYWSTQLQVDDPSEDLLVVMVYTDAPTQVGAESLKVNDLDLRLEKEGHRYWGNHFGPGSWYSVNTYGEVPPTPHEDSRNTVEVIRIPGGTLSGTFNLRVGAKAVVAEAVPGLDEGGPNQDFALYVVNASAAQE